jgi:4-amino-4-deoxy-L-arabinose transferase-like glycosyltransferase
MLVILLLSVALRLGMAFYLGDQMEVLPGTADQLSYHTLALRLLDGHGFTFDVAWWPATPAGEPTAHWSYLYTFFLVGVYGIFGAHPLAARLIQAALVGVLQPLLTYLLGKRVFGPRVGLISAGISAIYIYFIYYAGTLMTEPFYITSILASLLLSVRLADRLREAPRDDRRAGLRTALLLGVTLAITVLLRQLFLLVVPFLLAWVWWAAWKQRGWTSIPRLLLPLGVVAAFIAPFTAFNAQRFDRFVLLNTNAGFAFFWANHPIYGTQFEPILPPEMGSYQDLIPAEVRDLDEAAMDRALLQRGLGFVRDDPGRYLLLSLSRIPPYFMFWPSSDSSAISNLSRVGSFGLFLPFMLIGIFLVYTRYPADHRNLTSPLTLLVFYSLIYTGIHVLSWTLIRYRLPVDAVLLLFAAVAIQEILLRFVPARFQILPESP